ncbi:gamma-butyrobetaine hydroxylase-like domain-containing protein [Ferrimonas balearica]|uniref:gamma-butyrobetaine hydroxylase-like domain-containing protein n=1 Tax=Ferrimonas balearica TaxID=44012 RepID=UPI001C98F522|nr:DUF971 domain-containing protein [Ferrimonas balearica]MBY5993186.1 DUF971 domain-containing protein [Ferrimonas balearica]
MTPSVTGLKLKQGSRVLEVQFDNGDHFVLACELLRVCSPSAEVHGHGKPVLVTNKREVNIVKIEPVGNYAVKLVFDDGHDSGLYSWKVLHEMGRNQEALWADYLARLKAAKASREPMIPLKVQFFDPDQS